MEETNRQSSPSKVRKAQRHEGPRNHLITFGISLILTFLAFMAAANHMLDPKFVVFLLVAMAVIQALLQLGYWMHLKDRGHFYPVLFMVMGGVVAITLFVAAVYWMWW